MMTRSRGRPWSAPPGRASRTTREGRAERAPSPRAGARVLKVESRTRPDGARQGPPAFFDALNRDKEHVTIDFTRLVNRADDEQFNKQIGTYLDVDEFLRFIAVNALVANLDSIFSMGHNFYIFLNPKTNKFMFLPWDLDLSLAGFPMVGSPDQQMDLSLTHPRHPRLSLENISC